MMIQSKFYANRELRFTMMQTNFCPISFDCSVVDYDGYNGYGELGFDSGEGA